MSDASPLGLIAGNGRFPFLVARGARRAGRRIVAVAIREEAAPEIEAEADETHWVSLGQLGRCIEALRASGVHEAVMAGQVKHRQIFSGIVPDLKLLGVLARLAVKNTDGLIGGVAEALAREGITLLSSVQFLADQMATNGAMTRRSPSAAERKDIEYGNTVARALAGLDLGQTAVVKNGAAVAIEAMEGTDETIQRGLALAGPGAVVVKATRPEHDYRFDVPAVGAATLALCAEGGAAALAVEAGRIVLLDRETVAAAADAAGVSVVGVAGDLEAG